MDKSSPFTHPPDKEYIGFKGHKATNFEIERLQARVKELNIEITNLRAVLQVAAPHALIILDEANENITRT